MMISSTRVHCNTTALHAKHLCTLGVGKERGCLRRPAAGPQAAVAGYHAGRAGNTTLAKSGPQSCACPPERKTRVQDQVCFLSLDMGLPIYILYARCYNCVIKSMSLAQAWQGSRVRPPCRPRARESRHCRGLGSRILGHAGAFCCCNLQNSHVKVVWLVPLCISTPHSNGYTRTQTFPAPMKQCCSAPALWSPGPGAAPSPRSQRRLRSR